MSVVVVMIGSINKKFCQAACKYGVVVQTKVDKGGQNALLFLDKTYDMMHEWVSGLLERECTASPS